MNFHDILSENRSILTIFSVQNCAECTALKKYYTEWGTAFFDVDCTDEKARFRAFLESNGFISAGEKFTYPVVFKNNKIVKICSYNIGNRYIHIVFDDKP